MPSFIEGSWPHLPSFLSTLIDFTKIYNLHISTTQSISNPVRSQPDPHTTSNFSIPAKSIIEWMEPFPTWTGTSNAPGKKEGNLAWAFGDEGVRISSWEGERVRSKTGTRRLLIALPRSFYFLPLVIGSVKADQLSTEFFVDADDFLEYYIPGETVTIGFPMREFKVCMHHLPSIRSSVYALVMLLLCSLGHHLYSAIFRRPARRYFPDPLFTSIHHACRLQQRL